MHEFDYRQSSLTHITFLSEVQSGIFQDSSATLTCLVKRQKADSGQQHHCTILGQTQKMKIQDSSAILRYLVNYSKETFRRLLLLLSIVWFEHAWSSAESKIHDTSTALTYLIRHEKQGKQDERFFFFSKKATSSWGQSVMSFRAISSRTRLPLLDHDTAARGGKSVLASLTTATALCCFMLLYAALCCFMLLYDPTTNLILLQPS